ncbi:MAG: alpha/beta hydrolase [Planctomycetaceae bacterium]|nr:alpha/beta hydrolase [Planctomycetaceae bacterium]
MSLPRFATVFVVLFWGSSWIAADSPKVTTHRIDPRDETRDRVVPIKVYLPESAKGPLPVVLFSHGLGGSREGSSYLGEFWAQSGYVAVFPQHVGSDDSIWKDTIPGKRFAALKDAANGQAFWDRVEDVKFVLDQLEMWQTEPNHLLSRRMELDKIGMSGHSFGGRTTQATMGQKFAFNRSFPDPRLDAFIVMSPSPGEFPNPDRAFGGVKHPVLCMTGTRDNSPLDPRITPESRLKVYESLPSGNKFQVVFDHGSHSIFSDHELLGGKQRDPRYHLAIQKLTTAFWDAYLKGDSNALRFLKSDEPKRLLSDADQWLHE